MSTTLFGFMCIMAMEYLGLGYQFTFLQSLQLTTIVPLFMFAYAFTKNNLSELYGNRQIKILLLLILLTALSGVHGLVGAYAVAPLKSQIGYLLVLTVGYYALRTPVAMTSFLLYMVGLHCYAVAANIDKFDQIERIGGFKYVGYFLGDGNDFGWSLVITFAFALYLITSINGVLTRVVTIIPTIIILVGIIGTKSRGATLALIVSMLYYLIVISKRKLRGFSLVLVCALGMIAFAPSGYFERMETIANYEEDTSATARLVAWRRAFEMALDHPILGVGAGSFNSAYGKKYRLEGDPQRWISTHSVYFKVLAEYGFTGIIIFLLLIYFNFADNHRTARILRGSPGSRKIPDSLPLFLNMGLTAYSIGAVFLSGIDYPHIYVITAATLSVKWMAKAENSTQ